MDRKPIPGQEPCPPPTLRFPIRGLDLGFPVQGISCSRRWGEEEEREGHSRSAFLEFLAAAPSSCLELPLPGALAQGQAVSARQGDIPLGVPLGHGVIGDPPPGTRPTQPLPSQKQTDLHPGPWKESLGRSRGLQSTEEGFLFGVLPSEVPWSPPFTPREALEGGQRAEVDGYKGEGQRDPRF